MTTPVLRNRSLIKLKQKTDRTKANILLAVACFWPLALIALLAASAPHVEEVSFNNNGSNSAALNKNNKNALSLTTALRSNLRNVLDRVDVIGYGPTHPRVAFAVVGDNPELLVTTVESIFSKTDLNRIFVVTVVVDGREEDKELLDRFKRIDNGEVPHWHGFRPDVHTTEGKDDLHGNKVHVMFNPERRGVAESRADAVQFIKILQEHHEENGLKSLQEDLILVLMQGGSQLVARTWLDPVTEALIVPPPILEHQTLKLANAVSFNTEGPAKCTGFDTTFTAKTLDADPTEINRSSGASYPTPALNGATIALRLQTFLDLPIQDLSLEDPWTANLDLALNLWLCADGIDILNGVDVMSMEQEDPAPLTPATAARFAAAWMDEVTGRKFFNAYTKVVKDVTTLEWQTFMAEAKQNPTFTPDLPTRCRSFQWYAEQINPGVSSILLEPGIVEEEARGAENANELKKSNQNVDVAEQKKEVVKNSSKSMETGGQKGELARQAEEIEDVKIPARLDKAKPSKPLCDECMTIIQQAQPIDISYVDVTGGHKEHPHLGATDESGNLGYVADEQILRKNPPAFHLEGEDLRNACSMHDNNYKMLTERVYVDTKYDEEMTKARNKRAKIFCLVYTIDSGHPKLPAIRETWGQKCDGFIVASNRTDVSLGTVNVVHQGPEEYNNIWQKVRSMWSYVYDNYYEKYDFFHIGGDDLYLLVENLREYLESEEIRTASNGGIYLPDGTETVQTPLFMGRRFAYQGDMNDIFISGGSGYTMNKAALKTLVVNGLPEYFPHAHTFSEDTMVARIFRKFGVLPYETKDENGSERYMPFMPGHHYGYRLPTDPSADWYAKYSINIKEGPEHCSPKSVAFHYVKGPAMYRLHALLYKKCPAETETA